MKHFILTIAALLAVFPAFAGTITRGVAPKPEKATVGNYYVVSPTDIAAAQLVSNKKIEYILETYSDKELAAYVRNLNDAEINAARKDGTPQPRRLQDAELKDRAKIREYLRSRYKFTY